MICGAVVTLGCGGATLGKRFIGEAVCGTVTGIFYTALSAMLAHSSGILAGEILTSCMWRIFIFSILSPIGAIITELKLRDPDLARISH
jgi:hypothetical protein